MHQNVNSDSYKWRSMGHIYFMYMCTFLFSKLLTQMYNPIKRFLKMCFHLNIGKS